MQGCFTLSSNAHPARNLFLRGGYVFILRPRFAVVKQILKLFSETENASWFCFQEAFPKSVQRFRRASENGIPDWLSRALKCSLAVS